MKIYVINLKRREDRLKKILDKFKEFNFNNYCVVEAFDGKEIKDNSKAYKEKQAIRFNRKLTNSEIACAKSHQLCYQQIINSGEPGVIIEDDCPITKDLIDFASKNFDSPIDILLLGYYTSNSNVALDQKYKFEIMDIVQNKRVYFLNKYIKINNIDFYKFDDQSYKVDFLHGAHCYFVTPNGAKALQVNKPVIVEADNIWCIFDKDFNVYGARPMLVDITDDRTDSDINSGTRHSKDDEIFFKNHYKRFHHKWWGR